MLPRIISAQHDGAYRVWLEFSDGAMGTVNLEPELHGPLFEPLRDETLFSKLRLDADLRTVAWPNGADLAPEFLRELLESGITK